MRYDDFINLTNPTDEEFIGRYDGGLGVVEDYSVAPGSSLALPGWLARHFAKRLCDTAMIKRYGEPLRTDDPRRSEFVKLCLGDSVEVSPEGKPISMKEQIEKDRLDIMMPKEAPKDAKEAEERATKDLKDFNKQSEKASKEGKPLPEEPEESPADDPAVEVEGVAFEGDQSKAGLSARAKIPPPA